MLAETGGDGIAFIILLHDHDDARGLGRLLDDVRLPEAATPVVFFAPPVRGLAFFADLERQSELDAWWADNVARGAHPVYLLMHEEGLADWRRGLDGTFYVGVPDLDTARRYAGGGRTEAFVAAGPLDFAAVVMRDFSGGNGNEALLFDEGEALRMAALSSNFPIRLAQAVTGAPDRAGICTLDPLTGNQPPLPAAGRQRQGQVYLPGPAAELATPDPFDLLAASSPVLLQRQPSGSPWSGPGAEPPAAELADAAQRPLRPAAPGSGRTARVRIGELFRGGSRSGVQPSSDRELAQTMVHRGPTIVVMGSRKGGVGKTSFAAGVAIVAGTVLDVIGHTACIVDANIANPDAWGQMNLSQGAATVREVIAALTGNGEPPSPMHATTPALACYPEAREATEYSRSEIRRFAEHLRRRYSFIVVDMSNRLPDPMAGPEAAAAAFWMEHGDVLVLPTTSAKADFNGVLDYLDIGDRPPTVVPYIVPRSRRLRENRVTQEYVRVIGERVDRIIEIPDDANTVRLAGMKGVPVQELSPRLRTSYRELTEVIARMPRTTDR